MRILEQENTPRVTPRLEVKNQISSEFGFQAYRVVFGPELTAAVIFRLKGSEDKIHFPDQVAGKSKVEERELVGVDPGTTFQLSLGSDFIRLFSQHLIYRNDQGKESRVFLLLKTDNSNDNGKRRKSQKPEMAKLLNLFAVVIEENLESGKTDQAGSTAKGLRRLVEVLKQEDWKGDYLFEFFEAQKKALTSTTHIGG